MDSNVTVTVAVHVPVTSNLNMWIMGCRGISNQYQKGLSHFYHLHPRSGVKNLIQSQNKQQQHISASKMLGILKPSNY